MVDVRVTLTDGKYHDTDSSEIAFKIAGSLALKEAAKRAKPVLLEPIMAVEVVTPQEFLGDVIGDLSRRRGRVEGQEPRGQRPGRRGPACRWRRCSATRPTCAPPPRDGRSYTMQFDRYEEVPPTTSQRESSSTAPGSRWEPAA